MGTDQHLVVEWFDYALTFGSPNLASHLTFQVKLFPNGVIETHYCTLDGGGDTTGRATGSQSSIGIEDTAGVRGVSAAYKVANSASTATARKYTPNQ